MENEKTNTKLVKNNCIITLNVHQILKRYMTRINLQTVNKIISNMRHTLIKTGFKLAGVNITL